MNNDNVQHGIDDNPSGDAEKGAALGGLGGLAVGAAAGSLAGPLGTVIGAVVGGLVGAGASGAAVAAVDAVDNDNTVSGVGGGVTSKNDVMGGTPNVHTGATAAGDYERGSYVGGSDVSDTGATGTGVGGHNIVTGEEAHTDAGKTGLGAGAIAGGLLGAAVGGPVGAVVGGGLGSLAGGVAGDATEAADETTGTTRRGTSMSNMNLGNDTPGIQTGGTTSAGSDTRGITEKVADTVTGDNRDDKTGGVVGGMGTPDVYAGNERYSQLTSGDYATRPYGTYEGRSISRTDYNTMPENDRMRVQLVEEELHVDKEVRQIGEVEISKRVVSEQVSVPVTLEREEVIIHRTNVTGGAAGTIGADQTIVVPISEEFANVTKTAHVTGEVEVEKRMTSEQKTISDTVRREELEVNEGTTGRVTVQDDTTNRNI